MSHRCQCFDNGEPVARVAEMYQLVPPKDATERPASSTSSTPVEVRESVEVALDHADELGERRDLLVDDERIVHELAEVAESAVVEAVDVPLVGGS